MRKNHPWLLKAEGIREKRLPKTHGLLQRATRMDFSNYLPEDVLVKVDRSSMLNSLEIRSPLLDYRIIEFAFSRVPSQFKATSIQRKILLKSLAKKLLPLEFDLNRKQGFSIPLAQWLKEGSFRNYFYDVLLDSSCTFDREYVLTLLKGQDRGIQNSERLFGLLMFELWKKNYNIRVID